VPAICPDRGHRKYGKIMLVQKEKTKNFPKLSKYYVDEQGRLCRRYNFFEKLLLKITLAFKLLPVLVLFMIFGLMAVEVACFFGLYELFQNPQAHSSSFKIYIALICLIGVILIVGIKAALFLSEKHLQENQEFFRTKK